MTIRFDGKVAIVTGAGGGLGRSHAMGLAARGARVVVNDLGGARDGSGASSEAAEAVVEAIRSAGGEAIASGANVAEFAEVEAMVAKTVDHWGGVDILVNNAGILRDKTFHKMTMADFKLVVDVHLLGSANCTKAVWGNMRDKGYGRIVFTSSSSGLYGNFGQSNYAAAKMGLVGLMNALYLEGEKYGIRVNTLAPTAATRMTDDLGIPDEVFGLMTPESVTAALLYLASTEAPSRAILCAGAGGYARTLIYETEGVYLPPAEQTPENVARLFEQLSESTRQASFTRAGQQTDKFLAMAVQNKGAS